MMRVHLLAPPNAPTTAASELDGFVVLTRKFAALLTSLGCEVLLYGVEETDAPCAAFIPCVSELESTVLLGSTPYQYLVPDAAHLLYQTVNRRMSVEIARRKQPRDFICQLGGLAQQPVSDAHRDLMTVEYSIGYPGSFADYRVFESRAWQHHTYGRQQLQARWWDDVIPCFYDPAEYPVVDPEPYVVYVGRLTAQKGIGIACDVAQRAGVPLKVIGHGDASLVTYGEYLGPLSTREKRDAVSRALAVLCPTMYVEPFGQVAVEAQMSGVPVISTDAGGFTETVVHGVTGYRCRYRGEFVEAVGRALALDRAEILRLAVNRYATDVVAAQYRNYFERLLLLWTPEGWNSDECSKACAELSVRE